MVLQVTTKRTLLYLPHPGSRMGLQSGEHAPCFFFLQSTSNHLQDIEFGEFITQLLRDERPASSTSQEGEEKDVPGGLKPRPQDPSSKTNTSRLYLLDVQYTVLAWLMHSHTHLPSAHSFKLPLGWLLSFRVNGERTGASLPITTTCFGFMSGMWVFQRGLGNAGAVHCPGD